MKIFLDDIRDAPDDSWIVCRSVTAFKRFPWSKLDQIEIVSLDHDLGDNRQTGYDLMRWLEGRIAMHLAIPQAFVIHSANPVGRKNMLAAINSINRMRS